jgi:hypothetical protein
VSRLVPAFLAACVLVFFWPLIVEGRFLYYDDIYDYFHWRLIHLEMARAGRLIAWSPYEFGGMPTLGDIQKGLLYPLSLPFFVMETARAHSVYVVLHFLLGAGGAYRLARSLDLGRTAACVSAVAFAFGAFPVFHLTMTAMLGSTAWLPWVLLSAHRFLSSGRWAWWAAAAGAWAMQWLAGSPQIAYLTALAVAVLAAASRSVRRAGLLAVAMGVGCALAAPQLLPSLEVLPQTGRAGGTSREFASTYSLTPRSLYGMLVPYAWGNPSPRPEEKRGPLWQWSGARLVREETGYAGDWSLAEMAVYPGAATLALALMGAASPRRRLYWGLAAAAGISLWLALGPHGGLFDVLYSVLPGLDTFRAPCRFTLFFGLCVALMAGLGVQAARPRLWFWFALLVLAAGMLLVPALPEYEGTRALPLGALAGAATCLAARRAFLLPLVVFLDLAVTGHGYLRTVPREAVCALPTAVHQLARYAGEEPFRVAAGTSPQIPGSMVGRLACVGLQSVQGVNPVALRRYVELLFFNEAGRFPRARWEWEQSLSIHNHLFILAHPHTPLMGLLGTRFFLAPPGPRVIENLRALPRWWVASDSAVEPDGECALGRVQSGAVDPRRTILLAEPYPWGSGGTGSLRVVRYAPDSVELEVTASGPAWLGTSEVYERGWRATVNGEAAPVLRAFHALLAVPLPAGKSRVSLGYHTPGLSGGLLVGAGGLLAVMGALLLDARERRGGARISPQDGGVKALQTWDPPAGEVQGLAEHR